MTTIKLRIRVGVTADGTWIGTGGQVPGFGDGAVTRAITETLAEHGCGPVVTWHWITAEVPMPEVEQGEVAGEVGR